MSKAIRISYWVFTLWLCLGLASSGIVQVLRMQAEIEFILKLGFPLYIVTLLGAWKLLAIPALLVPKFPLLKEWAYAGIVFTMSGAIWSHAAVGNGMKDFFGPILMVVLVGLSWSLRPVSRKVRPAGAGAA